MMQTRSSQQRLRHAGVVFADGQPKWFNSPVSFHEGTLKDIRAFVPEFERRSFALTQSYIPVGVVSKGYTLVPHLAVLDVAEKALAAAKIAPEEVDAELSLTEYGERMELSL